MQCYAIFVTLADEHYSVIMNTAVGDIKFCNVVLSSTASARLLAPCTVIFYIQHVNLLWTAAIA